MSLLALPLDVQRLLLNEYLRDEDAITARCACCALRALVPRARIDACRHRLYMHFCTRGYTALLAWFVKQVPLRESYSGALCVRAARNGHVAALQWLREQGAPWHDEACSAAASGGHLATLQWLHANGAPWNQHACAQAARGGYLAMLQWLRANGAPWDKRTCAHAAAGGHLTVLQWSRLLAGERLYTPTARRGVRKRARLRPKAAIWRCCNGAATLCVRERLCTQTARHGTKELASTRPSVVI